MSHFHNAPQATPGYSSIPDTPGTRATMKLVYPDGTPNKTWEIRAQPVVIDDPKFGEVTVDWQVEIVEPRPVGACIKVVSHGFTEVVNYHTFAQHHVQNEQQAFVLGNEILQDGEAEVNRDQPEHYVTYHLYDEDVLRQALQEQE